MDSWNPNELRLMPSGELLFADGPRRFSRDVCGHVTLYSIGRLHGLTALFTCDLLNEFDAKVPECNHVQPMRD